MAPLIRGAAVLLTAAALIALYQQRKKSPMYPNIPKAEKKPSVHTCDSCGWEASGYSKDELKRDGWKWNALTEEEGDKRRFVTCDECEQHFTERRDFEAQFAG